MNASDKLTIQELAARFERAFDDADLDLHMTTWADDLRFESPFGNYSTHADYREWVQGFFDQMQQQGGTRHLITNHEIAGTSDSATMICYLTIIKRNGAQVFGTCRFDDAVAKIDGEWKFVQRRLTMDQEMPS